MREVRSAGGVAIVRSAPWPVVLGVAAAAAALLAVAVWARRTGVVMPLTLLGVATCGATAGYILDEDAAEVADATPASRPRRLAWRAPLAALPSAVGLLGLLSLHLLDPRLHWLRMIPVLVGSVAIGVTAAAGLRRSGNSAPGERAGVVALGVTVLLVATDPMRVWATLLPLGAAAHPERSVVLWSLLVAVCGYLIVICERDPGSPTPARASRSRLASHERTRA